MAEGRQGLKNSRLHVGAFGNPCCAYAVQECWSRNVYTALGRCLGSDGKRRKGLGEKSKVRGLPRGCEGMTDDSESEVHQVSGPVAGATIVCSQDPGQASGVQGKEGNPARIQGIRETTSLLYMIGAWKL